MRFLSAICVLFLSLATPAWAQSDASPSSLSGRPDSFASLAARLLPTVVNVSSTAANGSGSEDNAPQPAVPPTPDNGGAPFDDFYQNYMSRQQSGPLTETASLGSGFIIDAAKGLIITNNHVVKNANEIRVTMHDDTTYRATIVGTDDKTDLALLKIDTKGAHLSQVQFGDSDQLQVGDWILAIGNPFGLGGTVTAGIVSARGRDINAGPYDDFIQTDASINRGNSGGPMFNTKGELIGINTAIFSPSGGSVGIGFAIPVNMAKPVVKQLAEFGKTKRGWLGAKIQSVTPEIAESLNLSGGPRGALIANVTPDGPAAKAGFKPYDILLSFNGRAVNSMRDLPRLVAEADVNKPLPVELFRDGKSVSVTTTLGELEEAEAKGLAESDAPAAKPPVSAAPDTATSDDDEDGSDMPADTATTDTPSAPSTAPATKNKVAGNELRFNALAVAIAPITPDLTAKYNLVDGMTGIIITRVADYSDAARKGLLPGDVVLEVNQQKVLTLEELKNALIAVAAEKRSSVIMLVDRAGDERFVALKLMSKDGKASPPKRR